MSDALQGATPTPEGQALPVATIIGRNGAGHITWSVVITEKVWELAKQDDDFPWYRRLPVYALAAQPEAPALTRDWKALTQEHRVAIEEAARYYAICLGGQTYDAEKGTAALVVLDRAIDHLARSIYRAALTATAPEAPASKEAAIEAFDHAVRVAAHVERFGTGSYKAKVYRRELAATRAAFIAALTATAPEPARDESQEALIDEIATRYATMTASGWLFRSEDTLREFVGECLESLASSPSQRAEGGAV